MYCLIQLYVVVAEELSPHRPLLKLFSVKAVGRYFVLVICSILIAVFFQYSLHFGRQLSYLCSVWLELSGMYAIGAALSELPDILLQTEYMTAEDINIGIGAVLETFEMM